MITLLAVLGWLVLAIALLGGVLLNVLGLFGNWIILIAAGTSWWLSGYRHFGWKSLLVLFLLALAGEALEFMASGLGASKFGGSKGAMWAALVGCVAGAIVGSPLLPVIGTVIGACVGAFTVAAAHEYLLMERQPGAALWTGFGAALGKVAGMLAKFVVGLAMVLVILLTMFW